MAGWRNFSFLVSLSGLRLLSCSVVIVKSDNWQHLTCREFSGSIVWLSGQFDEKVLLFYHLNRMYTVFRRHFTAVYYLRNPEEKNNEYKYSTMNIFCLQALSHKIIIKSMYVNMDHS